MRVAVAFDHRGVKLRARVLEEVEALGHETVDFGTDTPDFMSWRANIHSRGRALLMLFLFSDVGENDAPTRIRVGSHVDIARQLAPAGEQGLTLRELEKQFKRTGF